MILNRLRLRGKMNLLILLPLSALVFIAVPFITMQVSSARSAAGTAAAARDAQALSNLVWQLQRERLLTAGFLVSTTDDGNALRQQHDAATTAASAVRANLGATMSDELASALTRLGSLA